MSDDATSDTSAAGWRLARLIDGFMMTQMLYVAAKLNIADVLSAGPRSGADIAAKVGAQSQPLTRLLRGLAAEGVLDETGDGRFALTPLGEALGHMRGAAIARGEIYFHSAERLLDGVREGGVPFELARGAEFFDYLHEHPDHERVFQSAMSGRSANEARAVVAAYDFGRFQRIVDVGGGHGVLLTTILDAAVDVEGVLFDQGSVVAEAQSKLDGSRVRSRIRFVGGDFFEQIPPGGDAYVLSRILHDWDDDNVAHILARCRAAMDVDARLLIAECVLPEDAKDNPGAIWMDVLMLLLLRSRERSESEFRHLLHANGFELQRVIPTGSLGGLALLEARPV